MIPAVVLVFVFVAALSLLKLGVKDERKLFVWVSIGLQVSLPSPLNLVEITADSLLRSQILCFALHFVVVAYFFCPRLHTASTIIFLSTKLSESSLYFSPFPPSPI